MTKKQPYLSKERRGGWETGENKDNDFDEK